MAGYDTRNIENNILVLVLYDKVSISRESTTILVRYPRARRGRGAAVCHSLCIGDGDIHMAV